MTLCPWPTSGRLAPSSASRYVFSESGAETSRRDSTAFKSATMCTSRRNQSTRWMLQRPAQFCECERSNQMDFLSWKVPMAQLYAHAWSCARRATSLTWSQTRLKCLQIWHAQFAAVPLWQTQCCYAIDVTINITCTASRRHWNKYQLVSGTARSFRSPEIHI